MRNTETVRILELMASKVCHDLISPIGAVSNGVEFLEEMGTDAGDEVTDLIAYSAEQASIKLKVFRLAYGAGGADSSIKQEDIHKIFGEYIGGDEKIVQNWDPYLPLGFIDPPRGFCKILLCCLILLVEALPKGGTISVTNGNDSSVHLRAAGENAGLREGSLNALMGTVDLPKLEPKLVHSYITYLLSMHYGFSIHVNEDNNRSILLRLSISDVS